ncbi:MAG TPA: hypothetical protein VEK75_07955 [Xanthobacteraceae bacterium]|nr:hypothetical protein [Xanthobacteraceae bacterium]
MLAEIFLLKLEAALRTERATKAGNASFIPEAPGIEPAAPENGSKDLATGADAGVSCAIALSRADEVAE